MVVGAESKLEEKAICVLLFVNVHAAVGQLGASLAVVATACE